MSKPMILGDWGTSSCRLYLCEGETILDSATAPGIKFVDSPEVTFIETVSPWLVKHGPLKAVLCGMVGSNIGWTDAGYLDCPVKLVDYSRGLISISQENCDVKIVPGVKTIEGLSGQPDVMRGEETQVFGWMNSRQSEGLLCLPGTHTKWVQIENSGIKNFMTSVNGEMFDVILNHSVLLGGSNLPKACIGDEYRHGVELGSDDVPLTQLLMSVRSQQIFGKYDVIQAKSYLLGLLIGSDVACSLQYAEGAPISVIGGSAPASFYAEAIRYLGGTAKIYGGQEASLTGLRQIMNQGTVEA